MAATSAEVSDDLVRLRRKLGDADADRLRRRSRQPAEPPRRVRQDERVGAGQERAGDDGSAAARLGHGVEDRVEIGRQELDGHRLGPLLAP